MPVNLASVRTWYGNYRIPHVGTASFSAMTAKGSVLIRNIAETEISTFSVEVKNDRTASVNLNDPKNPKITIPRWYFDEKVYSALGVSEGDEDYAAIAMINGSMCHEALHAYLTKQNLDKMLKTDSRVDDEYLKRVGQLGFSCMNCVEDIYIENRTEHATQTWKNFLQVKNGLLFQEKDIELAKEALAAKTPTATDIIGLLPFLKNPNATSALFRAFPQYAEIFQIAVGARSLLDSAPMSDRAKLAVDILKKFDEDEKLPDITPDDAKSDQSGEGDGEGGEGSGDGQEVDGDSDSEGFNQALKKAIKGSIESKDPRLERLAAEFENAVIDRLWEKGSTKFIEFVTVDVMSPELGQYSVLSGYGRYSNREGMTFTEIDHLAKKLRFRDKIHAPGSPHKSGPVILPTRLVKAPIDGKIFAPRSEKAIQPPEIGILVDSSGSMSRSFHVDGVSRRLDSLFSAASAAAEDLHETLAGIPHFVVAHTSTSGPTSKTNEGILVKVVSTGMNTPNTPAGESADRFRRLGRIDLNENFDGFAIRESLKFFTKLPRTKVLIVLSDGEPAGPGYSGSFGRSHTKEEIQNARRQGIKVIAISLVREVLRSNNDIYGPRYNVDGTAGQMAASIAKVINNLFEWR